MTPLYISLITIATLIIGSLAFYAGKLFAKIREQEAKNAQAIQTHKDAINRHNKKQTESIRLIAKAVSEQQCELSEGAIRICRLLESVHVTQDAQFPAIYPALHELDAFLADYPTHAGYKALKRQERMRFDVKRTQHEDRLKEMINAECQLLVKFTAPA